MRKFKIENEFEYCGFKCVVIFGDSGYRCGYVGISKEHKLYGLDYSSNSRYLKKIDIEDQEIGKRGILPLVCVDSQSDELSPDVYFDVHGGITYAGGSKDYPIESDLWWFGFDCAHYNDDKDFDSIFKYELNNDYTNELIKIERQYPTDGVIRTKEYVEQECRNLAEQLLKIN